MSEVGPNKNRAEQRPAGEGEEAGGVDAERQKVGTGLLTLVDFLVLKSIDPHFRTQQRAGEGDRWCSERLSSCAWFSFPDGGWRRTDDGISPGFEKRVAVARASVLWRSELATRKWGWRNSTKVQRDLYVAWESPIRVVCKRPGMNDSLQRQMRRGWGDPRIPSLKQARPLGVGRIFHSGPTGKLVGRVLRQTSGAA